MCITFQMPLVYAHILQCIKTKKSKSRNRINFNFHLIKYRFIAKVKKKHGTDGFECFLS